MFLRHILFIALLISKFSFSQVNSSITFPEHFLKSAIANLKSGDSLFFYQCHVEEGTTQLTTKSGETISGDVKKISITDKFIVYHKNGKYSLKYFTSTLSNFPNRKFSYLKVSEKEYWNFKLEKETDLNEHDVLMFGAIENKAHETNEFDFVIDKYNTNGLIIRNKKILKHLIIEGNYLLKKNLEALN